MSNKLELRPGVWAKNNKGEIWWIVGAKPSGRFILLDESEEGTVEADSEGMTPLGFHLVEIISPDLPEPLPAWPSWAAEEVVAIAEDGGGQQYGYTMKPDFSAWGSWQNDDKMAMLFPSQRLTFPAHLPPSERIIYRPKP